MTLFEICKSAERSANPVYSSDLETLQDSLKLVGAMPQDTMYMDKTLCCVYYLLTKKDNSYFLKVGNNLLYVTEDLVISAVNPINHSALYLYAKSTPIDLALDKRTFERDYPNMSAYISAFNLIVS